MNKVDTERQIEIAYNELAPEAIIRGLHVLNRTYGENWFKAINPESLKMQTCEQCVLGHLEGDYIAAIERVYGEEKSNYDGDDGILELDNFGGFIGLDSDLEYIFDDTVHKYHNLDRIWKRLIDQYKKEALYGRPDLN